MEQSDELGYAHFMEHLTFRGSRHVPDGESKRIWQRLGVTFGSDSNAQTTPTGTTYALELPQAKQDSMGESLQILADRKSVGWGKGGEVRVDNGGRSKINKKTNPQ